MEYIPVSDPRFASYGRIAEEYDSKGLLEALADTPLPEKGTLYVPSAPELEVLPVFAQLEQRAFGEMPVQLGYCNGHGNTLNALEYHASSEFNLACCDVVLLLGLRSQINRSQTFDTAQVRAFLVPRGVWIETYATTLHYAPCAPGEAGFRFAVALPRNTNLPLERRQKDGEMLAARNKWLLAHPDSPEARQGAYIGLQGENITI